MFCYENDLVYPVHVSDKNKTHHVYIKDFNRFMYNKTKDKNKKYSCRCSFKYLSSEKVLQ